MTYDDDYAFRSILRGRFFALQPFQAAHR